MGIRVSLGIATLKERKKGKQRQEAIEKTLAEDRKRKRNQIQVLVLGIHDSGKSAFIESTCLSNYALLSMTGLGENARRTASMFSLSPTDRLKNPLNSMKPKLSLENEVHAELVGDKTLDICDNEHRSQEYRDTFKMLWTDAGSKTDPDRQNERALAYFLANLDQLSDTAYQPTDDGQDSVNCFSLSAQGAIEIIFPMSSWECVFVDPGSQDMRRRKWVRTFEDTGFMVFFVPLSCYNQILSENEDMNQMQYALDTFQQILHSMYSRGTYIIIFLTRSELFKAKVQNSHIKTHFPDYNGEQGDACVVHDYFKKRFTDIAHEAGRLRSNRVHAHIVDSLDMNCLRFIQAAIEE